VLEALLDLFWVLAEGAAPSADEALIVAYRVQSIAKRAAFQVCLGQLFRIRKEVLGSIRVFHAHPSKIGLLNSILNGEPVDIWHKTGC
jgi:hypothetical protein